jgi:transposase, IS5 family
MNQYQFICLNQLVDPDHNYRKFLDIWSFKFAAKELKKLDKGNPYKGYGLLKLFKCLILQFMEDLSDRQLEKFLRENVAAKLFTGFELLEKTPDHTVLCKARQRIGTSLLSKIFTDLRKQLKTKGLMNETFSFVDASSLIAKANLWRERDAAIKEKYEKLNNEVLPKIAHDKEARVGCKGKDKFWYGYKKHVSVDMQTGLINKVAVTPANVTDSRGFKNVCPTGGIIYADKGYCGNRCKKESLINGCELAAIKRNKMLGKNRDLDRFNSKLRSPYERVFSKQRKRTRYIGVVKNQFSCFMESLCFNLKRLLVLDVKDLCLN